MGVLIKSLVSVMIIAVSALTGCSSSDADTESQSGSAVIQSITAQDASTLFAEKKAVIIDVREDNEWQEQHIPGAIHIPIAQLNSKLNVLEEYKNTPVIMQCKSGRRSAQAAVQLKAAGFKNIYNLDGGILAWNKAGLATE